MGQTKQEREEKRIEQDNLENRNFHTTSEQEQIQHDNRAVEEALTAPEEPSTSSVTVTNPTNETFIVFDVGRFEPGKTTLELTKEQIDVLKDNATLEYNVAKAEKSSGNSGNSNDKSDK